MSSNEIPSDDEVVAALAALGERVSARALCEKLVADGHPLRKTQLAIQRAAERDLIFIHPDWTLSVFREEKQAA